MEEKKRKSIKIFVFLKEDLMDPDYKKAVEKKIEVDMNNKMELLKALKSRGKFHGWTLAIKDQKTIQKRFIELENGVN